MTGLLKETPWIPPLKMGRCVYDGSDTELSDGQMYMIKTNETQCIRRVQITIDGGINLLWDNSSYPAVLPKEKASMIEVLGRVTSSPISISSRQHLSDKVHFVSTTHLPVSITLQVLCFNNSDIIRINIVRYSHRQPFECLALPLCLIFKA